MGQKINQTKVDRLTGFIGPGGNDLYLLFNYFVS